MKNCKNSTGDKVKVTKLMVVPYQLCPKCKGDGQVFIHQSCDVCGGAKIIPMHVLNPELLKISSVNYGEDGVGLSSDEIYDLIGPTTKSNNEKIN